MKTLPLLWTFLLFSIQLPLAAADDTGGPDSSSAATPPGVSSARQPRVISAGPDSRTWAIPSDRTNRFGSAQAFQTVREIGTGMNYWEPTAGTNGEGAWVPSVPQFAVAPEGDAFVALKVQHRTRIAYDLNTIEAVRIVLTDGTEISSTPSAIGLFSARDGRSVIVASILSNTNCFATLISSNVLAFTNAFNENGVRASILVEIQKGSLAQDVVIHALDPSEFGFGPDDAVRIQIYTELYHFPEPDLIRHPMRVERDPAIRNQMASPDLMDTTIGFSDFVLGDGKAYIQTESEALQGRYGAAPVAKEIVTLEGRTFIRESIEFSQVADALQAFNDTGTNSANRTASLAPKNRSKSNASLVAANRATRVSTTTSPLASIPPRLRNSKAAAALSTKTDGSLLATITPLKIEGLNCDYLATLGGNVNTNLTLAGDQTLFIASPVFCNAALTVEGGVVCKFPATTGTGAATTYIKVGSTLTLNTSSYRPALFDSADNDTVGTPLTTSVWSGYSGNTAGKYYASPALLLQSAQNLSHCRFSFAQIGVKYLSFYDQQLTVNHSQFVKCMEGIEVALDTTSGALGSSTTIKLNNSLFTGLGTSVVCSNMPHTYLYMNNCTFDGGDLVSNPTYDGVAAVVTTNSIFANPGWFIASGSGSLSGYNNGFYNTGGFGTNQYSSGASPFATNGGGLHYVNPSSGFTGVGATNLNSDLLKELRKRTTLPPTKLADIATLFLSTNLTLSPQVPRDADPSKIDLGYHYPTIDWALSYTYVTNSTLRITPGTAICFYQNTNFGGNMGAFTSVPFGWPSGYAGVNNFVYEACLFAHAADVMASISFALQASTNGSAAAAFASDYAAFTNQAFRVRTNFFYKQTALSIVTNSSGAITSIGNGAQGDFAFPLYFDMIPITQRVYCAQLLLTNTHTGYTNYCDLFGAPAKYTNLVSGGIQSAGREMLGLARDGYTDVGFHALTNLHLQQWLYAVTNGTPGVFQETTVSEHWNSYISGSGGGYLSGDNSFNHYALGSVGEWVYKVLGGVSLDRVDPGYQNVLVSARPGGGINYCSNSLYQIHGLITTKWTNDLANGRFTLSVTNPANTTLSVLLPTTDLGSIFEGSSYATNAVGLLMPIAVTNGASLLQLGSGDYTFTVTNFLFSP